MLNLFIQFFKDANNKPLLDKLLHSCYWQQHQFKAYGHAQINEVFQSWLGLVGRSKVEVVSEVNHHSHSFYGLQLTPQGNEKAFNLGLLVHHNGENIKSVDCYINTTQLAASLSMPIQNLVAQLPTADPLIISDYDHQNHLQDDHTLPSHLVADTELQKLLNNWWSIRSEGQISQIEHCYAEQAQIATYASSARLNQQQLFDQLRQLRGQFRRAFYQLQQILVEGDKVFVSWYFEGDEVATGQRERVYCCTQLTLDAELITEEMLYLDVAAHLKRYPQSQLVSVI